MKPGPKKVKELQEKPVYNLTMKFYNLLTLTATSIYTVGIWLWTPSTNPPFIKYIALGGLLAIQFLFLLFFALKKVKDESRRALLCQSSKSSDFDVCHLHSNFTGACRD